jgi:hypothetical protein
MLTTSELAFQCAALHHECAAYHFKEAAKCEAAGMYESAAHHAYLAHGHTQHAIHSAGEAAKLHADRFLHVNHRDPFVTDAAEPGDRKQSVA